MCDTLGRTTSIGGPTQRAREACCISRIIIVAARIKIDANPWSATPATCATSAMPLWLMRNRSRRLNDNARAVSSSGVRPLAAAVAIMAPMLEPA